MTIKTTATGEPAVDSTAKGPQLAIKDWNGQQVELLLANYGLLKEPVDIERLARCTGISKIIRQELNVDAMLVPVQGEHFILLNESHSITRQRFSCAHEIAHLLLNPASDVALRSRTGLAPDITERQCDLLAADLLMPLRRVQFHLERISKYTSSAIQAISYLARTFHVSTTASAIRYVEALTEPVVMVFSNRHRDTGEWRVGWSRQNTIDIEGSAKYNIKPGEHFPKSWLPFAGFSKSALSTMPMECYVESQSFGTGSKKFVLSFAFPNRKRTTRNAEIQGA